MAGGGSKPGERRGGRQKGTPNRIGAEVRDMVVKALKGAGGVKYLQKQADANPAAFMSLVAKAMGLQITATGEGTGKLTVSWEGGE